MKKSIILLIALSMLFAIFTACTPNNGQSEAPGPAKDDETPSEKVDIEIFIEPWVNSPVEGYDPYIEWLDNLTGSNWKYTMASDFSSELVTRAAANDMPDLIGFDRYSELFSMYDQDVLLDDWMKYEDVMPQTFENMGDTAMRFFKKDGSLTCVTTKPGDLFWAYNIRQDWLDNLGLKMPTNVEELLEVARAFTFVDPDGNNKDDTYAFTSAGGGEGIGEIVNLNLMFGSLDYYVTGDNKVSNYIVDGNLKKTLDLIKTIADEKLIDPDWYTIGWNERKPNLYNGMYGIVWYPPESLLSETTLARGDDEVKDWWSYMPLIDATNGNGGGRLKPMSPFGMIRTVSANAGKSEAKMSAITKFLEITALPNREYHVFRTGIDIDKYEMISIGDRGYVDGKAGTEAGARKGDAEGQCLALANYGKIINSAAPEANIIWGLTPEPGEVIIKQLDMTSQVMETPHNEDYSFLLNLNSDNLAQTKAISDEFMIKYILGERTDYEVFVSEWLSGGGQALLDEAEQQYKDYGIMN